MRIISPEVNVTDQPVDPVGFGVILIITEFVDYEYGYQECTGNSYRKSCDIDYAEEFVFPEVSQRD